LKRLQDGLRDALKETIGPVLTGKELDDTIRAANPLITVGDVVTDTALKAGMIPDIAFVDGKTQRNEEWNVPRDRWDFEAWVYNPPATITEAMSDVLDHALAALEQGMKTLVLVDGEEDLASLPCISRAPTGTTVIYGLPDVGAAIVVVDDQSRAKSNQILEQMEEI